MKPTFYHVWWIYDLTLTSSIFFGYVTFLPKWTFFPWGFNCSFSKMFKAWKGLKFVINLSTNSSFSVNCESVAWKVQHENHVFRSYRCVVEIGPKSVCFLKCKPSNQLNFQSFVTIDPTAHVWRASKFLVTSSLALISKRRSSLKTRPITPVLNIKSILIKSQ